MTVDEQQVVNLHLNPREARLVYGFVGLWASSLEQDLSGLVTGTQYIYRQLKQLGPEGRRQFTSKITNMIQVVGCGSEGCNVEHGIPDGDLWHE